MTTQLTVKITEPTKTKKLKDVASVTLPTPRGYITILPKHTDLLTALGKGTVKLTYTNQPPLKLDIQGGLALIKNNTITLMVL